MNWIAKLGYVGIFAVSLIVGLWNYLVVLSLAVIGIGFLDLLAMFESLFVVFVAIFMMGMCFKKIKLAGDKK